ncbi:MAG: dihydrofolate reductase family protein [Ktedonobacterales bacterium]|nr:dihydrofolate reductase family protein [Ktedonobacterales bacterium]
MPQLVCELIVTLDGFARGQRSPGYYGYWGPDFAGWIATNTTQPHRMLIGRRTYEMLAGLPREARDEGWHTMTETPGWLFSRTLKETDWPGLHIVPADMLSFVRELKESDGAELRTLGSISLVQQLLGAGLVDCLKLVVCPLILPKTGVEPIFAGLPDIGFALASTRVLDERVLLLEYRPTGTPPYTP